MQHGQGDIVYNLCVYDPFAEMAESFQLYMECIGRMLKIGGI